MNRRIIISEDEKLRILNLHENRKLKEWNLIMEQETTQIKDIKDTEYAGDVQSCRAAMQSTPINNVPKFGISFQDAQKKWKEANCNGSQNCIPGKASFNQEAGYALCEGKFPGQGATQSTTGPDVKTTFIVNGQKKTYATPEEITAAFQSGELNANTQVWSPSANLTAFTSIKDLPADNPLSAQFKPIMAQVAPEYKQSFTIKIIGADGKPVDMDNATIEKGIAEKTITAQTPALDPKTNTWSTAGQIEQLKSIFAKVVPEYQPTKEMPSTGNKTLDEWLKTQAGQTYLSKPDRPSQEAFLDYLEDSKDPIMTSVPDIRKILLGDVNKDTKWGRFWQKQGNRLEKAGQAFMGKDVKANTGYNPNQPKP